jgi:hypothetical protein
MRRLVITALAAVAVLALAPDGPRAQNASGSLGGNVLTEQGEPVADAVVHARHDSTGAVRTTFTDSRGRYSFPGLALGSWTVFARVGDGESISDTRTAEVRLNQTTKMDFSVGVGLAEQVTVTAQKPLVDTKETAGMLTVTGDQAENLPVSGRVVTDLALLDSSVRQAAPGTFIGERGAVFTVNGQSARSNSFLVDGLDNNDTTSGTTTNSFFSQQVVQEFVLMTHQYAPEFGGASGGLLNIVTRRGSNDPVFEVFAQGTTDAWNQTGDFTESLPDSGISQDAVERFQAGVSFGGPLIKDRAFFFGAYEHQKAENLLAYTGIDRDGTEGGRLVAPHEDDSLFLRTDFNLSSANMLMVRVSANDRSAEGINVGGVYTPEAGFSIDEQDFQLAASLKTVISPTILNETRFLASTSAFDQHATSDRPGVTHPSGIYGGNVLNRQQRDETKFQLVENVTWSKGSHALKFGVDATYSSTKIDVRFNPNGNFTYDYDLSLEPGDCGDLLVSQASSADPDGTAYCLGDPNGIDDDMDGIVDEPGNIYSYPVVYALIDGQPRTTLNDTRIALFAQDRVTVGRWLLEYGLRYDLSTYELPASARVDSTIPNGGASRDTDNLAPRFGFTYQPRSDGKLVVRGGAGVFYDKLVLAFPATAAVTSGTRIGLIPLQGFLFEFDETDVESGGGLPLVSPEPLTMRFSTGTELNTPYTVQWNVGIEQAIGSRQSFRADFVSSQGYDLPIIKDLNPVTGLVSGTLGLPLLTGEMTACPVDQIDPDLDVGVPCHGRDPEHGSIAAIVSEGKSWYTGLDLNYRWQGPASWFRASYTLSRSEDLGFDPLKGGISLPPDSNDIEGERGRSDGDRLHRLVLSGDLPLPIWGIRTSAVLQYSTGLPYNVTTGQDDNNDGILTDRPEGVGRNEGEDSSLAAINAVRDQEVVDLDPITSLPDEPDFFQIDLRLYKQFGIKDKGFSELFLQIFNLTDRENVGLIEGRAISPNFGEPITLAGPPRTVEVGLRVRY